MAGVWRPARSRGAGEQTGSLSGGREAKAGPRPAPTRAGASRRGPTPLLKGASGRGTAGTRRRPTPSLLSLGNRRGLDGARGGHGGADDGNAEGGGHSGGVGEGRKEEV